MLRITASLKRKLFQLIDRFLRRFNVHQNVVSFVQFVDRISQLTAAPVFQTVDRTCCCSIAPV